MNRIVLAVFVVSALVATLATCDRHPSELVQGQASSPSTVPTLAGTSWQLIGFQGSDGTTLTPDDRAKYTIEFVESGQVTMYEFEPAPPRQTSP